MLKKALINSVEPIAYGFLFILMVRRILGEYLVSLDKQALIITLPEMILWALVFLLFFLIASKKPIFRMMIPAWKKNWILLLFILFAVSSILWSINFYATLYKGIIIIGCSAIAAYTGLSHRESPIFRGFLWFSAIVAVLSFMVATFIPQLGTHIGYPYYGAWRGIFWIKNYMGPIMAFGNLVFLFNIFSSWKKLFPLVGNIVLYTLTALLVYLSKCATAMILLAILNLGFLMVAAWVKWKNHLQKVHYVVMTIIIVVILLLIVQNLNFVFGLFNRNSTLTGRIPLWTILIRTGLENHPYLGTGLGATWETNNFRYTTQAAVGWPFPVLMSDNGFIDIFMHLGLIGIILLLSTVFLTLFRVASNALKENTLDGFFPVLLMIFFVTVNISLSFILDYESFAWFLMVFALFSVTPLPTMKIGVPQSV